MKKMKPIPVMGFPAIALMFMVTCALVAQTAKKPLTNKSATKVVESKEHAAIRIRYEAKVKQCEQRWLDAKALAEQDIKIVNDPTADSLVKSQANLRLSKLNMGLLKYKLMSESGGDHPEAVACVAQPDGEFSDEIDSLRDQLKFVDSCSATYRKTIDKKNADLTVRESEQVKTCQSLGLYPPR